MATARDDYPLLAELEAVAPLRLEVEVRFVLDEIDRLRAIAAAARDALERH